MNDPQGYIWPNLSGGPVIPGGQGVDYLIVLPGQTELNVHFFEPVSIHLGNKDAFRITGGERITNINIVGAEIDAEDKRIIRLTLDAFGDWAPYRLAVSESARAAAPMDDLFSRIEFSFKVDCPNTLDCRPRPPGFETFPALKQFDYQAKDYESFKQAMLDRLPSTISRWRDRAEADLGIALVDLLAYVGDRLSYHQDRAAAESQLTTARLRESVSRHLRLLDYTLDPGQTAEALVRVEVDQDMVLPPGAVVETPAGSRETAIPFTLEEAFFAWKDQNRMRLYDFSHPSLSLPRGAARAAVEGHPEGLAAGSRLVIRRRDGRGGERRHLVTLSTAPLYKKSSDERDITVLTWEEAQKLPWDAALSKACILGNMATFHHGERHRESLYAEGAVDCHDLSEGPVGYREGRPLITVRIDGETWKRVDAVKASLPYEKHYQVMDLDHGGNRILFGDNVHGMRPGKYAFVEVEYHAGLGAAGNAPADVLTRPREKIPGVRRFSNPFAARGGREPETPTHGKMWGPQKIREQKRAVTPEDYTREAMSVPGVSRAMARFVWTGSWVTVRATIDPEGTTDLSDELKAAVLQRLTSRKMAGFDIRLYPVRYVPLEISIRFRVLDTAFRDQVLRDLTSALGSGVGADGVKGFFHPDNWTFGQPVTLSGLYAAIARVQGVESAEVLTFKRLRKPPGDELANGVAPMHRDEIARLDNDRNFPEHGALDLILTGGR